jgi:hypothetical protein
MHALKDNINSSFEKWDFKTYANVESTPCIGKDGTLYFGSDDSNFYAIYGIGNLADSPWPKYKQNNQNTGRKQ